METSYNRVGDGMYWQQPIWLYTRLLAGVEHNPGLGRAFTMESLLFMVLFSDLTPFTLPVNRKFALNITPFLLQVVDGMTERCE